MHLNLPKLDYPICFGKLYDKDVKECTAELCDFCILCKDNMVNDNKEEKKRGARTKDTNQ